MAKALQLFLGQDQAYDRNIMPRIDGRAYGPPVLSAYTGPPRDPGHYVTQQELNQKYLEHMQEYGWGVDILGNAARSGIAVRQALDARKYNEATSAALSGLVQSATDVGVLGGAAIPGVTGEPAALQESYNQRIRSASPLAEAFYRGGTLAGGPQTGAAWRDHFIRTGESTPEFQFLASQYAPRPTRIGTPDPASQPPNLSDPGMVFRGTERSQLDPRMAVEQPTAWTPFKNAANRALDWLTVNSAIFAGAGVGGAPEPPPSSNYTTEQWKQLTRAERRAAIEQQRQVDLENETPEQRETRQEWEKWMRKRPSTSERAWKKAMPQAAQAAPIRATNEPNDITIVTAVNNAIKIYNSANPNNTVKPLKWLSDPYQIRLMADAYGGFPKLLKMLSNGRVPFSVPGQAKDYLLPNAGTVGDISTPWPPSLYDVMEQINTAEMATDPSKPSEFPPITSPHVGLASVESLRDRGVLSPVTRQTQLENMADSPTHVPVGQGSNAPKSWQDELSQLVESHNATMGRINRGNIGTSIGNDADVDRDALSGTDDDVNSERFNPGMSTVTNPNVDTPTVKEFTRPLDLSRPYPLEPRREVPTVREMENRPNVLGPAFDPVLRTELAQLRAKYNYEINADFMKRVAEAHTITTNDGTMMKRVTFDANGTKLVWDMTLPEHNYWMKNYVTPATAAELIGDAHLLQNVKPGDVFSQQQLKALGKPRTEASTMAQEAVTLDRQLNANQPKFPAFEEAPEPRNDYRKNDESGGYAGGPLDPEEETITVYHYDARLNRFVSSEISPYHLRMDREIRGDVDPYFKPATFTTREKFYRNTVDALIEKHAPIETPELDEHGNPLRYPIKKNKGESIKDFQARQKVEGEPRTTRTFRTTEDRVIYESAIAARKWFTEHPDGGDIFELAAPRVARRQNKLGDVVADWVVNVPIARTPLNVEVPEEGYKAAQKNNSWKQNNPNWDGTHLYDAQFLEDPDKLAVLPIGKIPKTQTIQALRSDILSLMRNGQILNLEEPASQDIIDQIRAYLRDGDEPQEVNAELKKSTRGAVYNLMDALKRNKSKGDAMELANVLEKTRSLSAVFEAVLKANTITWAKDGKPKLRLIIDALNAAGNMAGNRWQDAPVYNQGSQALFYLTNQPNKNAPRVDVVGAVGVASDYTLPEQYQTTQGQTPSGKNIQPPNRIYFRLHPRLLSNLNSTYSSQTKAEEANAPFFSIVPRRTSPDEIWGQRSGVPLKGQKGTQQKHMLNTRPFEDGWLGNPYSVAGDMTRESAVKHFMEAFKQKFESDPIFKSAVLRLRGRNVIYNWPDRNPKYSHIAAMNAFLTDYVKNNPEQASPTPVFDKLPARDPQKKTMTYAGIGSSQGVPQEVLTKMAEIAKYLGNTGYTLRSGGAIGADTAFERGAKNREVFFSRDATDQTRQIAMEIHPNPGALMNKGDNAINLMARNTNQVFGKNLDSPVDFVIAWTPDGAESSAERSIRTGGTGQAIDMASRKGIPVINLAKPGWEGRLRSVLGLPQPKEASPATEPPNGGGGVAPMTQSRGSRGRSTGADRLTQEPRGPVDEFGRRTRDVRFASRAVREGRPDLDARMLYPDRPGRAVGYYNHTTNHPFEGIPDPNRSEEGSRWAGIGSYSTKAAHDKVSYGRYKKILAINPSARFLHLDRPLPRKIRTAIFNSVIDWKNGVNVKDPNYVPNPDNLQEVTDPYTLQTLSDLEYIASTKSRQLLNRLIEQTDGRPESFGWAKEELDDNAPLEANGLGMNLAMQNLGISDNFPLDIGHIAAKLGYTGQMHVGGTNFGHSPHSVIVYTDKNAVKLIGDTTPSTVLSRRFGKNPTLFPTNQEQADVSLKALYRPGALISLLSRHLDKESLQQASVAQETPFINELTTAIIKSVPEELTADIYNTYENDEFNDNDMMERILDSFNGMVVNGFLRDSSNAHELEKENARFASRLSDAMDELYARDAYYGEPILSRAIRGLASKELFDQLNSEINHSFVNGKFEPSPKIAELFNGNKAAALNEIDKLVSNNASYIKNTRGFGPAFISAANETRELINNLTLDYSKHDDQSFKATTAHKLWMELQTEAFNISAVMPNSGELSQALSDEFSKLREIADKPIHMWHIVMSAIAH